MGTISALVTTSSSFRVSVRIPSIISVCLDMTLFKNSEHGNLSSSSLNSIPKVLVGRIKSSIRESLPFGSQGMQQVDFSALVKPLLLPSAMSFSV